MMILKISKKWLWILGLMAIFLPFQFLTLSGFCYDEFRYLSKRELVDRALFGKNANTMTLEEKIQFIKNRDGSEYPINCRISGDPFDLGSGNKLINMLLGRKFYQIDCVHPNTQIDSQNHPYHLDFLSVGACAPKIVDTSGMAITKVLYDSEIKRNVTYWRDHDNF
jgi:hypothetical protein